MTNTDPIPVEWHNAIEAEPKCMALRSALADFLQEQGDELAAEAIRWSAEKQVSAQENGYWLLPETGLAGISPTTPHPPLQVHALWRLIQKWKNATPLCRKAAWQWQPKQQHPSQNSAAD